jgi:ABC-type phosphate/phosphonate transport system substrate-binding protein
MLPRPFALRAPGVVLAVVSVLLPNLARAEEPAARQKVVRIALSRSLLCNIPDSLAIAALQPLKTLIESQTGLQSELSAVGPDQVAEQLRSGKVDFVLLPGAESAWSRERDDQLRTAVLAVNQQAQLFAHVLVRPTSTVKNFAQLKGSTLALPTGNREHCQLFVDHECRLAGCACCDFFSKINRPTNAEDALDDLCDGQVDAIVVDGVCLDAYKRRKPGRFAKLKEIAQSPAFPACALIYRTGGVDDATLSTVRDGLQKAGQTQRGRQLLTIGKLTGFEAVPDDYDRLLTEFVKAYPPPTR